MPVPPRSTPTYRPRHVDVELDALISGVAAVVLEGPKAVGKTATAARRALTMVRLDDPAQRQVAMAAPAATLRGQTPLLLDEWQQVPPIWDAVRRAVDDGAPAGSFLLTGSASPASPPTHSGAGRLVTVRMRPLSLIERGVGEGTVSLGALLTGKRPDVHGHTSVSLVDYAREIVASGFPGLRTLSGRALRTQLDGYLARVVDRDVPEQGRPVRRPALLRRWMAAYAAATATTTAMEKIRRAAGMGDEPDATGAAARGTAASYREVLERLWLLDPLPGWLPSRNLLTRLMQAPRHHLADPALAARLLGVDEGALLAGAPAPLAGAPSAATPRDGTLLGQLFESLVTLSVRSYAQVAEAQLFHLRTHDGRREVDLIVARGDQRVVALEVKLSATVDDRDVRHLRWLRDQLGDELLDAVVVTTGPTAYRRPDGIAVVPAALLAP
jgi:predicted AAA+ superfamily ATPase